MLLASTTDRCLLYLSLVLPVWLSILNGCTPNEYELKEPDRFVRMSIPADNPFTTAGVALGRRLFFDPLLSRDSSLSCADCHQPRLAFTDGRARSRGVAGQLTSRSAPSLVNVAYVINGFFWDGRVATLEEAVLHPITEPTEMGHDLEELLADLRSHPDYPALFRQAFGTDTKLNRRQLGKALAQYLRSLLSGPSRYDRFKNGGLQLTAAEDRGRRIFFDMDDALPAAECGHCHVEPLFAHPGFFNNGLEESLQGEILIDPGRAGVSGRNSDRAAFRTPSLRNVALTAPYMHDGRFADLERVIDHYNSGGRYAENVNPNVRVLGLSERDKQDLIAFLHTLTDERFITE